jgi:TolA-binding protein
MKRTERRHLKEHELQRFAIEVREAFEARKRETTIGIVAVVVVVAAFIGYFGWKERTEGRADTMLAEALAIQDARVGAPAAPGTPNAGLSFPTEQARAEAALARFKAVADAYPSSQAGIFARYQEAVSQMTLGQPAAAAALYQDVIKRDGSGIYGQMARLGLAEAQARAGQYDLAIKEFSDLSQRKDGPLPVDAILMQLGRTYLEAGKRAEAQQTFNRIVQEYPDSPFSGDARRELDNLKKT